MLQTQPVRDLLRRVPQPQTPLHLPSERTIGRRTPRIRLARTPAHRTLSDDQLAAATAVAGDLPRDRRDWTPHPLSDPAQGPARSIPSAIPSRCSNDRRAPGSPRLQLKDHQQASNSPVLQSPAESGADYRQRTATAA